MQSVSTLRRPIALDSVTRDRVPVHAVADREKKRPPPKSVSPVHLTANMALLSFTEDTEPAHIEDNVKWKQNENPAPRKPKREKEPKPTDEIYSLSFDQVNDNADELIELRGEGRYFGVTDPSTGSTINAQQSLGPLCDNCHKRGHVRSKCKTVVCHKCGVVGDHYETQCPTTMICSRCGERGHMISMCESKTRKKQYCRHCDTFTHGDDNCPSIWRSYITKVQKEEEYVLPVMNCYNCGDDTHFGDECPEQRNSRIPNSNGSAFSGSNLPKHLRSVYYDSIGQGSGQPKKFSSSYSNSYSANYNPGYGLGYSQNGGYNQSYGSNRQNDYASNRQSDYPSRQGDYSNSRGAKLGPKKSNSRNFSATDSNSRNFQQPYSEFLSHKTSGKKNNLPSKPATASRSGYLPKKNTVKPNRSGVLKGKKRNIQNLY